MLLSSGPMHLQMSLHSVWLLKVHLVKSFFCSHSVAVLHACVTLHQIELLHGEKQAATQSGLASPAVALTKVQVGCSQGV